jgi:hypothetical protein
MAKRVSPDEKPFNPVDEALTRSVLRPDAELNQVQAEPQAPSPTPSSAKIVSIDGARKDKPAEKADAPADQVEESAEPKKLTRARRFLLTEDEDATLEQLATDMGKRLRTPLTLSHLLRATATLLMHSGDELLKQSEKMKGLKRPANNDPAALASFEHNITRLVDRAIRNSKVLD